MSTDSKLRDSDSGREVKKLSRRTLPALDVTRRNRVMVGVRSKSGSGRHFSSARMCFSAGCEGQRRHHDPVTTHFHDAP